MNVKNFDHLQEELTKAVRRAADAALEVLSQHVESTVIADYIKRVQQLHYPLRNPKTRAVMESMPPKVIATHIKRIVSPEKATVYLPPGTDADQAGRMQELYGGKPWQKIRLDMQNLENVNAVLNLMGLKGIKAIPRMR
jgi:hypothetical protein